MAKNRSSVYLVSIALVVGVLIALFAWRESQDPMGPRWDPDRPLPRDLTVDNLSLEMELIRQSVAYKKTTAIAPVMSVLGWQARRVKTSVLCFNNTNVDDWRSLREDAILSVAERTVPYTHEASHLCAVIYIVTAKDQEIWRVEVDAALEEKIWSLVNQNSALDRCSSKDFKELLLKEAKRAGQLTTSSWQYM